MTKQTIHAIAVKSLNSLKQAGINQGGRAMFGPFAEAKRLTQQWAAQVRVDVVGDDKTPDSVRTEFLPITGCAVSLTFKGWGDLTAWLVAVEGLLTSLISENEPAAVTVVAEQEPVAPAEWVYFQCKATSGWNLNIRRIRTDAAASDFTEVLVDGAWEASSLTLGDMRAMVAFGAAEFVDAPQLKMVKAATPEWVYFVNLGTTGTIRRYDANSPEGKTQYKTHAGEWEDSTLTGAGARQKVAEGSAVLCNEFGSALESNPVRAVCCQLLQLIETRGFGPELPIVQMWGDSLPEVHGLARSLRLRLIGDAGHTGNGLTSEQHQKIRALLDVVPTRQCSVETLVNGWTTLHRELTKLAIV